MWCLVGGQKVFTAERGVSRRALTSAKLRTGSHPSKQRHPALEPMRLDCRSASHPPRAERTNSQAQLIAGGGIQQGGALAEKSRARRRVYGENPVEGVAGQDSAACQESDSQIVRIQLSLLNTMCSGPLASVRSSELCPPLHLQVSSPVSRPGTTSRCGGGERVSPSR